MRPLSPTDATDGLTYVEAIEARLLLPTHGWRAADRTVARTEPTPGAGFQVGDERTNRALTVIACLAFVAAVVVGVAVGLGWR